MKRWLLAVVLPLVVFVPIPSAAQVVWDAPSLIRPGAPTGLSAMLLDAYPGDELGALVQWRRAPAPLGLGFRVGVTDDARGDLAALFGVDVSGPVSQVQGSGEPDVIWWTGAGLGVGEEVVVSFPVGLSLGWNLRGNGVVFSPNFGGHVALDVISGPGDDLDVDASVDLGVDLGFESGLMARFSAAIGGREAFAVGVRLPH